MCKVQNPIWTPGMLYYFFACMRVSMSFFPPLLPYPKWAVFHRAPPRTIGMYLSGPRGMSLQNPVYLFKSHQPWHACQKVLSLYFNHTLPCIQIHICIASSMYYNITCTIKCQRALKCYNVYRVWPLGMRLTSPSHVINLYSHSA